MDWLEECRDAMMRAAVYYEKLAPTVADWLNDLYARFNENADAVILSELLAVRRLKEDGAWMHPNYAANYVYKLQHRLGRDVTGQAGY